MKKTKNKDSVRRLMNEWGGMEKPFLFIIDFEMEKPLIYPLTDVPSNILFDINGVKNHFDIFTQSTDVNIKKFPLDKCEYEEAFDIALAEIKYGNSFLLNLTFPTPIECNLSLKEIYTGSKARYKLLVDGEFVVFSPEIFVKIKDRIISSHPMKGTIDAGIENAREKLLNDEKERAEHNTIVDLIRNDISMVAKKVHVKRFRYIDRQKTHEKDLYQMSSEIEGILPEDYKSKLGDIIFTLLPGGSISGAPKPKTVEIIRQVEGEKRGYYTGIFGYFDGKNLDSGVMIRYIEKRKGHLYYRSGCGITHQSSMESEYLEMIDKVYMPVDRKTYSIKH